MDELILHRLNSLETSVEKIQLATEGIDESLRILREQKVEISHLRKDTDIAFADIRGIEDRLKPIEVAMPGLQEIRQWVILGVLGTIGIVGTGVIAMVVKVGG